MLLRINVILLAVISPLGLRAADDGSEQPSSYSAPLVTQDPFDALDLDALQQRLTRDRNAFWPTKPGYNWGSLDNADSLFRNNADGVIHLSDEFPFSPRRMSQLNYDTGIPGEVEYSGEFTNPAEALPTVNIADTDSSLPVIIPAGGTASEGRSPARQAISGKCEQCADRDDCPIEVVVAEDEGEADCSELAPGCFLPLVHAPFGRVDPVNGKSLKSVEECSHTEPPLKAKVEHLLEAARHLAGAGYEDEAKLFRVEAEAIQKASTRLLTEKRQELERLQREIAELEALTGQYQMIQISCRILEFQRTADGKACANLHPLDAPGIHVLTGQACSQFSRSDARPLSAEQLAAVIRTIENQECGSLKTVAEPVIVTMNGRPASLRSGGEFPILIPVSSESGAERSAAIEWRNFGVSMQAVPFVLGDGKVRLSLETEVADRDFSNAANVNGTVVPGLTVSKFRSDVETRFGETVAIALNSPANHDGRRSLLVLVTAEQIERPVLAQPSLD